MIPSRRDVLASSLVMAGSLALPGRAMAAQADRKTRVSIEKDQFHINGRPTYEGRSFRGHKVEGLLMNSRMVQGIFDDLNPQTRSRWVYPDTKQWDADRNTREFIAAMPAWREHGLLGFTINLQGGSPQGYSKDQPWENNAFEPNGALREPYMKRLAQILDRADELGMVAILGYFYFGQDERLKDEKAVRHAVGEATGWLVQRKYRHVIVEVANECDNAKYDHAIIKPAGMPQLIEQVRRQGGAIDLRAGASFNGGRVPTEAVVAASDFVLIHGNGVSKPQRIAEMVRQVRALKTWRTMPILFNEDDHFDFDQPENNFMSALSEYASWGYFDPGKSDYVDGYQCPPVNWGINTPRKQAFFKLVKQMTGGG